MLPPSSMVLWVTTHAYLVVFEVLSICQIFFLGVHLFSVVYNQIAPRQNHVGWGLLSFEFTALYVIVYFFCFLIIFSPVLN